MTYRAFENWGKKKGKLNLNTKEILLIYNILYQELYRKEPIFDKDECLALVHKIEKETHGFSWTKKPKKEMLWR